MTLCPDEAEPARQDVSWTSALGHHVLALTCKQSYMMKLFCLPVCFVRFTCSVCDIPYSSQPTGMFMTQSLVMPARWRHVYDAVPRHAGMKFVDTWGNQAVIKLFSVEIRLLGRALDWFSSWKPVACSSLLCTRVGQLIFPDYSVL